MKAALSVNSQMIMLYHDLGRQIIEKQEASKWGSGFIEQLSRDLREEFPEMAGFSAYNLRFMRVFYKFYAPIWEQVVPEFWVKTSFTTVSIIAEAPEVYYIGLDAHLRIRNTNIAS
ncbi:MAG: DUF1016 N-terminal domain-containing protein [Chitinispirillia bacterium]|nr:DUF1016 N-terminal domain-containing protein [Chitinispirillia bacterium]